MLNILKGIVHKQLIDLWLAQNLTPKSQIVGSNISVSREALQVYRVR